jgi:ABC-type sugar transport system ATPase subunit
VLLETRDLGKSYGTVRALIGVSVSILAGEVHALIGENGAGKSTFINLLAGVVHPSSGSISIGGEVLEPGSVRASEAAGIAVIHQESTAFQHLDALDNLFVGREPRRWGCVLDRPRMRAEGRRLLAGLGETLQEGRPLAELSVAQRQMVAIARALSVRCRLLVLDEPTASLSARECGALFAAIRRLTAAGGGGALCQPSAGGDPRSRRPRDGAARWQPCRDPRRRRPIQGRPHPLDGRTRGPGAWSWRAIRPRRGAPGGPLAEPFSVLP